MAITIVDSPNDFALLHQKLIYLCTSGNVANDGFRFQFEITINSETLTFLVPPNPNNKGIFDIREAIRGYFTPMIAPADPDNVSIHDLGASDAALHEYEDGATSTWIRTVVVTVKEGWIISGVFTPTAVGQATDTIRVLSAKFERLAGGKFPGYQPSPDYISEQFLTDRIAGVTNVKGFPISNGFGFDDSYVKIPVRSSSDRGIVSFIVDNGTLLPSDTGTAELRLTIYESDGTPHSADYTITTSATGRIAHFGAYPYNLNNTAYVIIKPSDYPNFRCYTLELVDGANAVYGQKLLFYPVDYDVDDCLLGGMGIKLGWINSLGGWDYFLFTKLFVEKYEIERKRFRKVLGTYGAATFDFAPYDRGLTEIANSTDELITMSTDWLEDGEFSFLGNLIRSRDVYIIQSGPFGDSPVPVVIERNDWEDQKQTFTQIKKLELTVRCANKLW